jgi:hypothetical protein
LRILCECQRIKLAFVKKLFELKVIDQFTKGEEEILLLEHAPAVPNFSVIGFEGSYQG